MLWLKTIKMDMLNNYVITLLRIAHIIFLYILQTK